MNQPASARVFIGLGSNLGDRWVELKNAVIALPDVDRVSPVYETEPLDVPGPQSPYLNCVVELHTALPAQELRKISREIEIRAGRSENGKREPRSIDVDILLVGDARLDEPGLTVPHPRMWERRFVVQPLRDLAPELVAPGWEANVRGSVRGLTENASSAQAFAGLAAEMSNSNS